MEADLKKKSPRIRCWFKKPLQDWSSGDWSFYNIQSVLKVRNMHQ